MNRMLLSLAAMLLAITLCSAQDKKDAPRKQNTPPKVDHDAPYRKLGPDSQRNSDIPAGKLSERKTLRGKTYKNVEHDYAVYLPPGLDKSKPAKLMLFMDGAGYSNPTQQVRIPIVMDNLLHKKELPPIVCVFVNPGVQLDNDGNRIRQSNQRSIEYDTMSATFSEFVLNDLLPRVEKEFEIKFSTNPNDRAVCGISSGGICAFTLAWERPDQFHKVMTHVGSFTNIRGGHVYPDLVRKSKAKPKPLRIFIQDGLNDLDNQFGNWPLANQEMAAAFQFAGYDYRFEYGTGAHSLAHGGYIMPEALKWLWREEGKK